MPWARENQPEIIARPKTLTRSGQGQTERLASQYRGLGTLRLRAEGGSALKIALEGELFAARDHDEANLLVVCQPRHRRVHGPERRPGGK